MLGLALLLAMCLYIGAICAAVFFVEAFGKRRGWPLFLRWLIAPTVVLLFIVPPFWDWLPTRAAHRDFCSSEAGYHQFKTLERWEQENPSAAESIHPYTNKELRERKLSSFVYNDRFAIDVKSEGPFSFNLFRFRTILFDRKTGEILADLVDISAGYGNSLELGSQYPSAWKIWLDEPHCPGYSDQRRKFFSNTKAFRDPKKRTWQQ